MSQALERARPRLSLIDPRAHGRTAETRIATNLVIDALQPTGLGRERQSRSALAGNGSGFGLRVAAVPGHALGAELAVEDTATLLRVWSWSCSCRINPQTHVLHTASMRAIYAVHMNMMKRCAGSALAFTLVIAAGLASPAQADPGAARDKAIAVLRTAAAPEIVHVITGTAPAHAMEAVTLTDESCQPDNHGMSHCLNKLKLANGQTIVVRHDHDMHAVPCLTPGEAVHVAPIPS
jgi:hypothetical protein